MIFPKVKFHLKGWPLILEFLPPDFLPILDVENYKVLKFQIMFILKRFRNKALQL